MNRFNVIILKHGSGSRNVVFNMKENVLSTMRENGKVEKAFYFYRSCDDNIKDVSLPAMHLYDDYVKICENKEQRTKNKE